MSILSSANQLSSPPELVHGRADWDCTLASLSMALKIDYDVLLPHFPQATKLVNGVTRGIGDEELVRVAIHLGYALVNTKIQVQDDDGEVYSTFEDFLKLIHRQPAMLAVNVPSRHMVYWDGTKILDPWGRVGRITDYMLDEAWIVFKISS